MRLLPRGYSRGKGGRGVGGVLVRERKREIVIGRRWMSKVKAVWGKRGNCVRGRGLLGKYVIEGGSRGRKEIMNVKMRKGRCACQKGERRCRGKETGVWQRGSRGKRDR